MLSHKEALERLIVGRTKRLNQSIEEWSRHKYDSEAVEEALQSLKWWRE